MRFTRKTKIAIALGLVVGGLAATAAAGGFARLYPRTPYAQTMIFGSSGNIAAQAGGAGTVGPVLPGQCELIGVGDYIPSTGCPGLLSTPYELTETPIAANSGVITHFTVITTKPAGDANRIVFWVRLCEHGVGDCNTPPGGLTIAHCSPLPGSYTCSWIGKLKFQQWQPSTADPACGTGVCFGSDPLLGAPAGQTDYGLIDVALSRGCGDSTCPNGTYDPGHVQWSVSYLSHK